MKQSEFMGIFRGFEHRIYGDVLFTKNIFMVWIPDFRRHINHYGQSLAAHGITREAKWKQYCSKSVSTRPVRTDGKTDSMLGQDAENEKDGRQCSSQGITGAS